MNDAATPTKFADVAATLHANGYRPVPIAPGKKHPPLDKWQHFAFTSESAQRFGTCGAGILLGDVVALDVDVDDPDAVAAIVAAARETAGIGEMADIPARTGRAPRRRIP
jgi:hypothetical protein